MTVHMKKSELTSKLEEAERRIAELESALAQKDRLPSEYKQAEEARQEAELRYRALFEQSHDAIFILSLMGRHLAVNQRAADMLGFSREELLQISAQDLSAEPAESQKIWHGLLNGERIPTYERSVRKKDGSNILVEINVELVHDAHGNPLHIQSVVRDITKRRQAEIELQHRNEDLGLINAINEVIVQGENLETVVKVLAKQLKHIFSVQGTSIYMLSLDGRSLTMQQYAIPSELNRKIEKLIGSTIPIIQIPVREGGLFERVLNSRQGTITSDPQEIQTWIAEFAETSFLPPVVRSAVRKLVPQIYKMLNIKSTIVVPLISNGSAIGLLDVSSSGLFTADDLQRIENIGLQLTAAIQRQQAHEKIQGSEEFLNSIQNALSASIAILDETGVIVRVNAAWRKFGERNGLKDPDDCIGQNYLEICESASGSNAQEAPVIARAIREVITRQRKEAWVEYPCHSPEEQRWFIVRITRFEDGARVWVVLAHENITERKQAENSLQRSEAILAQAAKMAHLGAWEIEIRNSEDLNDNPLSWSDEVYRIFGYEPGGKEITNEVFFERVHPDDRQKVEEAMRQAIIERKPYEIEHRITRPDGVERIVEERADFIFDERGKLLQILGAVQDVTEHKQTEQTLRETSEQFRTLFEASPEAIMLVDPHGDWPILDCNATACSMNGYTREELIGQTIDRLMLTPGDAAGRLEYLESIRKAGILRYDDFHRHKDGGIFPIETSTSLITLGGREIVLGIDRDITERKRSESALRESESRYRALFEDMPIAIWEEDFSEIKKQLDFLKEEGVTDFRVYFESHPEALIESERKIRILDVNNAALRMYGANSKEELLKEMELKPTKAELEQTREVVISISEGKLSHTWEGPDETMANEPIEINIAMSVSPGYEKDYSRVIVTTTDITQRKWAEEELRQSEKRYRTVVENQSEFIVRWRPDGVRTFANEAYLRYFALTPEQAFSTGFMPLNYEADRPAVEAKIARLLSGSTRVETDIHRVIRPDGGIGWQEWTDQAIYGKNGEIIEFQAVGRDITERKSAESALRESEHRYRALFEDMPIAIWEEDFSEVKKHLDLLKEQGVTDFPAYFGSHPEALIECDSKIRILDVNNAAVRMYGANSREELLKSMELVSSQAELDQVRELIISMAEGKLSHNWEGPERTMAGQPIEISLSVTVSPGYEKDYSRVIVTTTDITQRRRAERELRASEERFRQLADNIQEAFWITDAMSGEEIYVSPAAEKIWGHPLENLMYDPNLFIESVLPEDRPVVRQGLEIQRGGRNTEMEYRITRPDGAVRWIWDRAFSIFDDSGKVVRLAGVAGDITERKKNETETIRHLAELEALYENGLAVGRLLEPQAIGQRIIQTFSQYLSWHHVTIRLRKDESDELELIAFHLPHMTDGIIANEEHHIKSHVSRVGQGISGWVVETGSPIRTSNLLEDPHYVKTYEGMQSGLYMPLKVGDRVIGVISVESDQMDAFSEQDERLLATLANQAATAFENARLYQSAQQELWDRRIAEEALRQSEENYRRLALELEARVYERTAEVQDLYDNAPCGYHSLDQDGRIIRINQTELNWLGYTREEVIGQPLQDFITNESRINFMKAFPAFKQHGLLRDLELEMLRKDGSIFPALISATAIYDKDGRYTTSRSTLFDDTDRKHAMEALRLANSEMKRAMRMKDEFLANMSHELRTPLNAILGLSESLLEQTAGPINEKQHKYLGTVNESGRHLLELINDILDLAKIESGQIKIDPVRVNISTACETSLRMIKQLAQKKNQTVEVEIENEIGHVWADERRLKQMMVNLLSNAVKFTPESGQLGLKARIDRKEMNLLITIWDRGIGIREQDLKRLFRPFVQLDSSLARESAGTGLGLALVAEMARLHGGSVSVSSQPGEGSQFTIVLPWDPAIINDTIDKLKITGKIPIMRRSAADKPTILLVEDTESVVLMLRDYLELSGYQVVIAMDGLEGVSKAIALQPELILMDVQMPSLNGLEATRQLRKEDSLKDTPIIALTALAMPSDRERCLEAGMSDYFSKPINLKELAKAIQRHLPDSGTGKTYEYDTHRR